MRIKSLTAAWLSTGLMAWLAACPVLAGNSIREKENIDFDWKFSLNADNAANSGKEASTDGWQDIQLPHDWSISLPFGDYISGSCGSLPGGIGWYRRSIDISKQDEGKQISVLFDGIYSRSDVWINGHHLGFRPYGFCYIEYDITPYLDYGGENVLAVRVNNPSDNDSIARWYTGSGINRHAWIVKTSKYHVSSYGTYITTPKITSESAEVSIRTTVSNNNTEDKILSVSQRITDAEGIVVAKSDKQPITVKANSQSDAHQSMSLPSPILWSVDNPYIYKVETTIYDGKRVTDRYVSTFGVRTVEFTSDNGFLLNGERLKLKGFCLHQDDASLGSALPFRSMQRKLEIMKSFGVNAVRCSHNQPAPEFLDLCDEMGFIVIDEAFDKWKSGYYAQYFDEWWQADLNNMLVRDRNHPSVVIWSIGNELQEAWDGSDEGVERARMLQDFVHEAEPSRQVCLAAQNNHQEKFSGVTDVVGYNYLEARMLTDHKKFPERKFIVTEELPYYCGAEGNIRAYDTNNPWNIIASNDFIAGGFLWTGFDYIGEAVTPSRGWPNGLMDICMVEKPRAAFHKAMWNATPLVSIAVRDNSFNIDHGRDLWQWPNIASTWNLPQEYEGLVLEVQTITNCEKVVLYLNGKEMGNKLTSDYPNNTIVWNIPYTPGHIMAKGINGADTVAVYELHTAGEPTTLVATPDRDELLADGQDLSYIQVELRDEDGNLVQHIDRNVKVNIEGEGRLIGFINSYLRRDKPFTSTEDKTYFGRAMAIVQTTRTAGPIKVTFDVEGLNEPIIVNLTSK